MLPVIVFECGADSFLLVSVHAVSYPSPLPPETKLVLTGPGISRVHASARQKSEVCRVLLGRRSLNKIEFIDWLVLVLPSCAGDGPRRQSPESWKG